MKKLFILFAVAATAIAAESPNIVFIYADDLGYGDVGCYNPESKVPTPNLDRLAAEGMRFTDAPSPSTVCTPSRYGVMTGRMPFRLDYAGVFTGVEGPCLITKDRLTLPEMLRQKGYATALFGKWHIGMTFFDQDGKPVYETSKKRGVELVKHADLSRRIADGPLERGFDEFFGTVCCPTTDWLYAYVDGDRIPVPPGDATRDASKLPDHPYSKDCRPGLIASDFDLEEVDMVFLKKSKAFLEKHVKEQPGKIKPGSESAQTICQTDIMHTCAAITGSELPVDAAEDSFSFLPVLLGEDDGEAVRPYALHQTIRSGLSSPSHSSSSVGYAGGFAPCAGGWDFQILRTCNTQNNLKK